MSSLDDGLHRLFSKNNIFGLSKVSAREEALNFFHHGLKLPIFEFLIMMISIFMGANRLFPLTQELTSRSLLFQLDNHSLQKLDYEGKTVDLLIFKPLDAFINVLNWVYGEFGPFYWVLNLVKNVLLSKCALLSFIQAK